MSDSLNTQETIKAIRAKGTVYIPALLLGQDVIHIAAVKADLIWNLQDVEKHDPDITYRVQVMKGGRSTYIDANN